MNGIVTVTVAGITANAAIRLQLHQQFDRFQRRRHHLQFRRFRWRVASVQLRRPGVRPARCAATSQHFRPVWQSLTTTDANGNTVTYTTTQ